MGTYFPLFCLLVREDWLQNSTILSNFPKNLENPRGAPSVVEPMPMLRRILYVLQIFGYPPPTPIISALYLFTTTIIIIIPPH